MHNNQNHIGPNWTGRANRTLVEAYPMTHDTTHYPRIDRLALRQELIKQARRARRAHVVDVAMMVAFLVVMYGFMKAPVIWQWLVRLFN